MLLAGRSLFARRGASGEAARAAVIANTIDRDIVVDHCLVVGVVHHRHVYVGDRAVIDESTSAPISARITHAGVAKTVVDSAIKSDVRAPVSRVPKVYAAAPAPIARSPKKSNPRRNYPCSRHPEITVRPPSPIAGHPDKPVSGTGWLFVNRQRRRPDAYGNANADLRQGWGSKSQHSDPEQQTSH